MANLNPIHIDSNWHYQLGEYSIAYLRRSVDLEPIEDVCIRYWLCIEAAPNETQVWINKVDLGRTVDGEVFNADVTDYVSLEDNELLFVVSRQGSFGNVWIERVPCEPSH